MADNPQPPPDLEALKAAQQGLYSIVIRDKAVLYAAYMPYLKRGGIFIPTKKKFDMGQELVLEITLLKEDEKHPVTGNVVLIIPSGAQGNKKAGIGIQFAGEEGEVLRHKIDYILGASINGEQDTFTM